jgi:hypothetical protein
MIDEVVLVFYDRSATLPVNYFRVMKFVPEGSVRQGFLHDSNWLINKK